MFNEEERLVYEVRMQALMDVESKLASAEEKGLAQGMEKGLAKGMAQSLMTVLTAKYGMLPDEVIERINKADNAQLQQWMSKMFAAGSLEELLAR